jgi:hypothetical protein
MKKMECLSKEYHYSAKVNGSESFFHGAFETDAPTVQEIVRAAKSHLSVKLAAWTFKNEDVVYIDIYHYHTGAETIIFNWKK